MRVLEEKAAAKAYCNRFQPNVVPIAANTTPFLYAPAQAIDFIRLHRWKNGQYCPHCRSTAIKRVNSYVVNEIFHCMECDYCFNSTSGTVFQGSKLDLNRHLLLLISLDHFGGRMRLPEIASLAGVSLRTARLQKDKLGTCPSAGDYLVGAKPDLVLPGGCASILELLEQSTFSVDMDIFSQRLKQWLQI